MNTNEAENTVEAVTGWSESPTEVVTPLYRSVQTRSLEIGNLVAALATAQSQFEPIFKETANPFFKSKYADLSQVIAATRKPLADNGLVVIQTPIVRDKNAGVVSILAHKSGEWIQDELLLPAGVSKFDAQTIGSAITYARRYSYQALIGVAAEVDDDANHASGNNGSKEAAKAMIEQRKEFYATQSSANAHAEGAGDKSQGKATPALKIVHFDTRGEWTYLTGDGLGTLLHFLGLPAEEGGIYQFKEKFMAADKDDQGFPTNWRVRSNKAELLAEAAVSYGLDAKQVSLTDQLSRSLSQAQPQRDNQKGKQVGSQVSDPTGPQGSEKARRVTETTATANHRTVPQEQVRASRVDGPAPAVPKRAILAEGHLAGTLDGADLTKLKQKAGQYLKVKVGEYEASLFDNVELDLDGRKVRAFVELPNSLHQPVEFLVKPNGQYLNVVRILRLGCFEWSADDGLPIRRYDAPTNSEISDADLGI